MAKTTRSGEKDQDQSNLIPPISEERLDLDTGQSVPISADTSAGDTAAAKVVATTVPAGEIKKGEEFSTESLATSAALSAAIASLRQELQFDIARINDQITSARINENGLLAEMVGGQFNCPKCGLRLGAPAMASQRGQTYDHPFDPSPRLSGIQCELKGRKFQAPIVFLQFAPELKPKTPLTTGTK